MVCLIAVFNQVGLFKQMAIPWGVFTSQNKKIYQLCPIISPKCFLCSLDAQKEQRVTASVPKSTAPDCHALFEWWGLFEYNALYQQSWNWQKLAAEQHLLEQPIDTGLLSQLPSQYKSCLLRPFTPAKLGRTLIRASILAAVLCGFITHLYRLNCFILFYR